MSRCSSHDAPEGIAASALTYYFVKLRGLEAGLAGIVWLFFGLWNAVNYPLLGYISDRTRSKIGRRLPYIRYGAPIFGLAFMLLWMNIPGSDGNQTRSRYEDMGTLGNLQSRDPHPLETATLQGLGRRLMGQQPEMLDPTLQRVLATVPELPEGYTPYGLYRAVQDTQGGIAPPLRLKTDPATAQVPPPPGRGIMRVKPPGEAAAATPTEPVAPAGASPSRPGTPKGRVCAVCGKPGGQPYSRRLGIGKDAPVERDYVHRQHVRPWLNAGDRAGAAASPKGNTALPRSAGQAFGGEMSDLDHYVANAVSNEGETAATGEAPIRALYNAAFYADQYGVDVETFRKAIRDTYGVAEEKPVTVRTYHCSPERKAFVPDPRRAVQYKNVKAGNDKVSLGIDDLASVQPWGGRGVKIHGTAEIVEGSGRASLVIHPTRLWSWGVDDVAFKDGKPQSRMSSVEA